MRIVVSCVLALLGTLAIEAAAQSSCSAENSLCLSRGSQAGQTAGNIARFQGRLAARNVVAVMDNGNLQALPSSERQADRIQITAAGHDRLAAAILPEALAALGR